jgi:hypothetical protein
MMSANFEFVSLYCPHTLALRHVTLLQDIDAPAIATKHRPDELLA